MQAMVRKRHRLGAWSLVFLMGLWLLGQAQAADAALQQPIALPTAELRRKLRDRELPTYVIEWVMPAAYRRMLGLKLPLSDRVTRMVLRGAEARSITLVLLVDGKIA
jgi:hypothetical protein